MQNDLPRQPESPLPDPSSPPFPALRRHHQPQPTPTVEAYRDTSPSGSTLRRRHVPAEGDIIRIDVRTPFDDGVLRIKEGIPVHRSMTIREIKDDVAVGKFGQGGIWQREGMRIVWQGRIVRDEEVVGEVVANSRGSDVVHTLHLVARRLGGTPSIARVASGYFNQPIPAPPVQAIPIPAQPNLTIPPPVQQSMSIRPESQALLDSIHYLLFTSRHQLFHLLGREPLRWDDMVPAPIVVQSIAREAVMSVIRTICDARPIEERSSWEGWEAAFDGDDVGDMGRLWSSAGSRESIEADIRTTWRRRVGREWSTGEKGEIVEVEIDQNTYQLHLPRLSLLTANQLVHLRIYLKITSLLPMLYPFIPPPPSSSPIINQVPAPTPAPAQPRPTFRSAIAQASTYIPRIPLSVLQHMFFSALRSVAMLWMLTQGMPWSDSRLWIMGGAVAGWWIADGWQQYVREGPRIPQVQVQGANVPGQQAGEPDMAARNVPGAPPQTPGTSRNRRALHLAIPLVHLDTDTTHLRLIHDPTNPTRQLEVARTPSQPIRRPPRIITQLLLPIALWFITLIPEFEAIRTRTIRRRERAMRVLVGELSTPAVPTENTDPGSGTDQPVPEIDESIRPELILPEGLNEEAKKYYLRVMERGEGIDWEEEREAQRAMGVGEEEGQGGLIGLF